MNDDELDPLGRQATLLNRWVELRRQINALEAQSADLLCRRLDLLDSDVAALPAQRKTIERSMICEYAAAGRISKGSVEFAFADARMLADLPALKASFLAGRISVQHVRHIIRASATVQEGIDEGSVEPAVLGLFEQAALEFAESESPGRTNAHVKELAAALAPETVVQQNRRGERERRAWIRSFDDGVSILHLILPTAKAVAILDRTKAIAREALAASDTTSPDFQLPVDWDAEFAAWQAREQAARSAQTDAYWVPSEVSGEPGRWVSVSFCADDEALLSDEARQARDDAEQAAIAAGPEAALVHIAADDRTLDQVQADVICDLLLGADPSQTIGSGLENITARVQVTVSAGTLAGLDDDPAQLDGYGPIDPDVARRLAGANKGWTRLFLDARGMVTSTDTYTPTTAMQRFLRARDQRCRFPGCRQPVHLCQIDHTHDHAKGGVTDIRNLAHLCVTHHSLKHPDVPERFRWHAAQRPDWTIEWTSPTQRTYVDAPPRRVMFVPSAPRTAASSTVASSTATSDEPPPW